MPVTSPLMAMPAMSINYSRRQFIKLGSAIAAGAALPVAISRALAIPAQRRLGTIEDVQHVVILMQENRSFDHYFGTLPGVRGFADRFPIPLPDIANHTSQTAWWQFNETLAHSAHTPPFRLDTVHDMALIRTMGAHHVWPDAQQAWNHGSMNKWPTYKGTQAMGYYAEADIPFQFALANAFTICDAYHCSFAGSTVPNRNFLWTGTNDPHQLGNGPVIANTNGAVESNIAAYSWTTYPERLEHAGISWRIYQDLTDDFSLNPLVGYQQYRHALKAGNEANSLKDKALSHRNVAQLKADVLAGKLAQISWIIPPQESSEHPGPSSPAQGADYTAQVLDALTADPDVWGRTVLLLMFDENDGFFDHVPPPAVPSAMINLENQTGLYYAGASNIDTHGEYHLKRSKEDVDLSHPELMNHPYGMGPRVPMYAISPWSKGGWVNSEVFDHTSVIRFLETRFGVHEPNISPWRRAVAGDLTSVFDFSLPDTRHETPPRFPATAARAAAAHAYKENRMPHLPLHADLPWQAAGFRPSRALPYELHARVSVGGTSGVHLILRNTGKKAAVFHVYDRLQLEEPPRRYTLDQGTQMDVNLPMAAEHQHYDLWISGPGGFHRHATGRAEPGGLIEPRITASYQHQPAALQLELKNISNEPLTLLLTPMAYAPSTSTRVTVFANSAQTILWPLHEQGNWYDVLVTAAEQPYFAQRFAGRVENGKHLISDPAMGGQAVGKQFDILAMTSRLAETSPKT